MPDLTGLKNLSMIYLQCNYFTFDFVEAGFSYSFSGYFYNPQLSFPLTLKKMLIKQGSDVNIDITALSINDLGGPYNLYQWFKNGFSITSPNPCPVLGLSDITLNDSGIYTCQVSNTVVTDLILYSDTITLNAVSTASKVANSIADKVENKSFGSLSLNSTDVFNYHHDLNHSIVSANTNVVKAVETEIDTTNATLAIDDGKEETDSDELTMGVNTSTSIKELAEFGLKVYPVRSKGSITIEKKLTGNVSVQVLNMSGKTVLQKELNHSKTFIDLSKNGKGVYFISLIKGGEKVTSKVIIV